MAAIEWTGFLTYAAKHSDIDSVLKSSFVPVSLIKVKGGAKRVVFLSSTDNIDLVSEIEQARSFKNISLYLPPTQNFEWLDLTEIAVHKLPVSINFFTYGSIGKTITHQFQLICENAEITATPNKDFDPTVKGMLLGVHFALPETRLIYGSQQGSEFIEEKW